LKAPLVLAGTLAALLLAGGVGVAATARPDTPVTSPPLPGEPPIGPPVTGTPVEPPVTGTPVAPPMPGGPTLVTPRPGMAGVRPVPWQRAVPDGDRALVVTWTSGVEPCSVLDSVRVSYAARTVTVTLREGHDPAAGDVACIEIARETAVRVSLAEPLRGRTVVDGAA